MVILNCWWLSPVKGIHELANASPADWRLFQNRYDPTAGWMNAVRPAGRGHDYEDVLKEGADPEIVSDDRVIFTGQSGKTLV